MTTESTAKQQLESQVNTQKEEINSLNGQLKTLNTKI
jgi:hypothetical protein